VEQQVYQLCGAEVEFVDTAMLAIARCAAQASVYF